MTTRDKTSTYQQIWANVQEARAKLGPGHINYNPLLDEADREQCPWIEVLEEVKESIKEIKTRMKQLKDLHKQCLKPKVQQQVDECAVEIATAQLQSCFKDAEAKVRKLVLECQQSKDLGNKQGHDVVVNMQTSLVTTISELSRKFREDQRQYLANLQKQKERARKFAGIGGQPPPDEEEIVRQSKIETYVSQGFTQEQIQLLVDSEMRVNEREKDLRGLYADIVDLHEIFKDMAALVVEQGSLLDRIDYNIEGTRASVLEANQQLQQGSELQQKMTYKLCILALVVAIIGFGFAFAMKI
eukprot:NODE_5442_length_1014_cov_5.427609_g4873_i0.p1 GENE.NODE_5442_length_1014_cov_5.427609_g4873_i0~~NODE_5442_length_1014_cov_5.427609_g4873_i0.p1  ORF type:complete len:300 (+),score=55.28 NODE_5442_length_1014_cov_5.427609_g4873_i0:56-955(+)